jgi:uncharacterized phage infection (PIP) family protein YhgE
MNLDKLKEFIKNNPTLILAFIAILIIMLIYITVYYRGFWKIGPFTENMSNKTPIEELAEQINEAFQG